MDRDTVIVSFPESDLIIHHPWFKSEWRIVDIDQLRLYGPGCYEVPVHKYNKIMSEYNFKYNFN